MSTIERKNLSPSPTSCGLSLAFITGILGAGGFKLPTGKLEGD